MGDDLRVVNAARVSFAKESRYEEDHFGSGLPAKDIKLIEYLAKHGHWSPFSHCFLTFRIKAPIFVARQLQKHQVGLAWNEVSRRYVDSEPEFYVPEGWRKRAENVKQGSSDELISWVDNHHMETQQTWVQQEALKAYRLMLDKGVCPEQARMVLPQSMMTEWYWSGSLYAFARVVKQRTDSHAQKETQEVAKGIAFDAAKCFPYAWSALMNN
jgi:thymidylate synthase (FAD)